MQESRTRIRSRIMGDEAGSDAFAVIKLPYSCAGFFWLLLCDAHKIGPNRDDEVGKNLGPERKR
jgi:hypothetical protein